MKKKKQALLTAVCALLLVATSVLGTIAYLTSEATVTNTFTVGNVEIELKETQVDEDGNYVDENGNPLPEGAEPIKAKEGNEYHLVPGKSYLKDPQMTVIAGSEESYVRMILTVKNKADVLQALIDKYELEDFSDLFAGWINEFSSENKEIWEYIDYKLSADDKTISFEFRYRTKDELGNTVYSIDATEATEDINLPPLFTSINVPESFTGEDLAELYGEEDAIEIIVEGHAIQAVGFVEDTEQGSSAEDEAWKAFEEQKSN